MIDYFMYFISILYKVGNVSVVLLLVMVLKEVIGEVIMTAEEEAAVQQEEEAFLAAELLISLLRAFIQVRITVIIVI